MFQPFDLVDLCGDKSHVGSHRRDRLFNEPPLSFVEPGVHVTMRDIRPFENPRQTKYQSRTVNNGLEELSGESKTISRHILHKKLTILSAEASQGHDLAVKTLKRYYSPVRRGHRLFSETFKYLR